MKKYYIFEKHAHANFHRYTFEEAKAQFNPELTDELPDADAIEAFSNIKDIDDLREYIDCYVNDCEGMHLHDYYIEDCD